MDGEEAEKLVHEVLLGVPGYQDAYVTNPAPWVVMAQFHSPAMALRAIRNQKVESKDAGTPIVGIRKSLPERTSPLQSCEQIEEDVE